MIEIVNYIINEHKENGYINFYIVGQLGSGKTTFMQQLLSRICKELNIEPNIDMIDFSKNITSVKGINLIESYREPTNTKHKVNVLCERTPEGFIKGYYKFNSNISRFLPYSLFGSEYEKKKQECIERHFKL